ncbi:MAG: tyrosine-type recombinase/integrase [Chloroflexota bacterium]
MLAALRGVLKECWRLGYVSADDYQRAVDFKPLPVDKPEQAAGRSVTDAEMAALMKVCADDKDGDDTVRAVAIRDAALISLAYAAGLRRAELASLQVEDYNAETGTFAIRGKHNKTRTVPLKARGAVDTLNDWLHVRGREPGPLFQPVRRGGHIQDSRLVEQSIYDILTARAEQVGISDFSPHDMRRTYAGDLLDAGVDLSTVQKLMGHSSANTTAGYDRRGERAKTEAAERLHIPWKRQFRNG